ncbi:MAG: glycosyltransferase [Anaerolineales bacterium]|nr:glycosyltransferase [Anaerolineales bacterium]
MRIALVTTYPPGMGSLNEYAFHFVKHLRQKPEVEAITLLVDELPPDEQYSKRTEAGADISFDVCWRFEALNNTRRIVEAVQRIKPDVVLFNIQFASFGSRRIPAALGLTAPMRIKRATDIPTFVLLHNIMETVDLQSAGFAQNVLIRWITEFFGAIFTRQLLKADLVALTIPKYVEILQRKYKADNVLLAPHGAFDDAPPLHHTPAEHPFQVMTFGKFGTYKKVEPLIRAIEHLQQNGYPDLELVVAGSDSPNAPGYLANVQTQYAHVPHIRFTGYVPEAAIPDLFTQATVVVFPYESTTGSSGVLHQAGSYGRACVLPHIGDFKELVEEEGYKGEYFEANNHLSLAAAIEHLLSDPAHRHLLEQQNYLAANGLPMREVVDWYLLHIEQLLGSAYENRNPAKK